MKLGLLNSRRPRPLMSEEMPPYTAEQDADRLLRETWLGWGGEIPVPVDPIRIADRLGIQVFEAPLEDDVSGLLVKLEGKDPNIYLNQADSVNRQRFTCAHEIGHYLRRPQGAFQYVDKRDVFASAGTHPEEVYANAFAAALLMPAEHVRAFVQEGLKDYEMAVRFKVSPEAMRYRLSNLALV